MKKLLSIILSILMVASMFSIIAVPTVMAEEAAAATDGIVVVEDFSSEASIPDYRGASFDNGALKVDMTTTFAPAPDRHGILFNVPVNTNLVDANTVYQVSVRVKTEKVQSLCFYTKVYTNINGTQIQYKTGHWGPGEFNFIGTGEWTATSEGIPTEWTEKVSAQTFSPAGNNLLLEIRMHNQDTYTEENKGIVWIDDIKLIPVEKIAGGSVKITGTDANGNTVYTAKADKGYKVTDISARDYDAGLGSEAKAINEISRTNTEVQFTVSNTTDRFLHNRYLTVNFAEMLQHVDDKGAVVIETFNSEAAVKNIFKQGHFDNGAMKIDMAQTGNSLYGGDRGGADFTVPVDTALLDANTEYNFSIRFRTEGVEDLGAFLKAQLSVNGTATNYHTGWWGPDNFQFFADETGGWLSVATEGIPTEWTEVVCPATFMLAGNTLSLYVNISTTALKGTLWIDDIKLVPVKEKVITGGTVKATGKDANGNDIYTATADDGYKVGTIKADNYDIGSSHYVETVNEISRTDKEVKFTVSYANSLYLIRRHLTVSFDEVSYIAENGRVVITEFNKGIINPYWGNATNDNGAMKIDLSKSVYAPYGLPGIAFTVTPDMSLLNVNQKYRVSITARSDKDVVFDIRAKFYGTVNGTVVSEKWNIWSSDDYQVSLGKTFTTNLTEYTAPQTFVPFGNDFYVDFIMWTGDNTANIWIDKIEFIPVDDGIDDGVVKVTGKTESGATIYTAYANEGYTVDAINAKAGKHDDGATYPLNVSIVEKVSDREVSFTVDSLTEGQIINVNEEKRYYIQAIFGSEKPIIMDADDEYIVCDFSENSSYGLGNATALYEEDINTGSCYASDAATTDISFYVDANTVNKFDAASDYKVSALIQSTDDWQGRIRVYIKAQLNNRTASVLSELYAAETYLLGNTETSATPGSDFGWSEYKILDPYVFPVVGEYYQIRLYIERTSETGTIYLDNIAIKANDYANGYVQVTDYAEQNGFVKSRYDIINDRMIYTTVAFDGYELDNLSVKTRVWGIQEVEGVTYNHEVCAIFEMPRTFDELKSITESTFSIDTSLFSDHDGTKNLRFQTHFNMGKYCTVSFKEAVAGVAGDANDDGVVNVLDFIKVKKYLSNPATQIRIINIDVNDTQTADTEDFIALKKQLLGVTA